MTTKNIPPTSNIANCVPSINSYAPPLIKNNLILISLLLSHIGSTVSIRKETRGLEPKISLKFKQFNNFKRFWKIFSLRNNLCREQELNLHALAGISTSRIHVYHFITPASRRIITIIEP